MRKFIFLSVFLFALFGRALNESTQSVSLDGVLYKKGTTTPLIDSNIQLKLQVLNPQGTCVLYEEQQTVSTATTKGYFNIQLGSAVGSGKRTGNDPGRTMAQVFQNIVAITANDLTSGSCAGNSYIPTAGDVRYFRLTVTPSSTGLADRLTPDIVMDSVPQAIVAQSVQGLERANILSANTAGSVSLDQTNLESLFTGTAWTNLQSILNGNFLRTDTSGATLPSYASTPAGVSIGDMWYDSTTNEIKYQSNAGVQALGAVGVVSGSSITSGTISGSTAWNTSGNIATSGSVTGASIVANTVSGSTVIATTVSGATVQGTTLSGTSVQAINLRVFNGSQYVQFTAQAMSSSYSLALPTADGVSGQVMATNGAGVLNWITPSAGIAGTISVGQGGTAATAFSSTRIIASNITGTALTSFSCSLNQVISFDVTGAAQCSNVSSLTGSSLIANGGNSTGAAISIGTNDNFGLSFKTNNATALTISTNGNVGIGTTTPSGILEVDGGWAAASTNGTNLILRSQGGGTGNTSGGDIRLIPGGAQGSGLPGRVHIQGDTTNANPSLNVQGMVNFSSNTLLQNSGNVSQFKIYTQASPNTPSTANVKGLEVSTYMQPFAASPGATTYGGYFTTQGAPMANQGTLIGLHSDIQQTASSVAISSAKAGEFAVTNWGSGSITSAYGVYVGSVHGTNKWSIYAADPLASSYFAGNVGIGTTAPISALDISGSFTAQGLSSAPAVSPSRTGRIYFDYATNKFRVSENGGAYQDLLSSGSVSGAILIGGNTTGTDISIGTNDNKAFALNVNSSTAMTISQNGNVGIGTSSPSSKFTVNGDIAATNIGVAGVNPASAPFLSIDSSTANTYGAGSNFYGYGIALYIPHAVGQGNGLGFMNNGITTAGVYGYTSDTTTYGRGGLVFKTNPTGIGGLATRLTIDPNGNVGIGTTAPSSALDISGSITAQGLSSAPSVSSSNQGRIYFDYATNKFRVSENGGAYVDLVTSGSVSGAFVDGGNTTTATAVLGTNSNQALGFETNGATAMTISQSGNVGIGTATPGEKLHVHGGGLSIGDGTNSPVTITAPSGTLDINSSLTVNGSGLTAINGYNIASVPLKVQGMVGQTGDLAQFKNSAGLSLVSINSGGNVGIGTSTPTSYLTVKSGFTNVGINVQNSGNFDVVKLGSSFDYGYLNVADTSGAVGIALNSAASSAPKIKINSSGTSKADGAVSAYGSAIEIRVPNVVGQENGLFFTNSPDSSSPGAAITHYISNLTSWGRGGLYFKTSASGSVTTRLTIDPNGNVGIGTTAPSSALDISGSITAQGLSSAPSVSSSNQGRIYFDYATNKFRVSENGGAFQDLVGGGVSGLTAGKIPKASGSSSLQDSLLSESGNTISMGSALAFNISDPSITNTQNSQFRINAFGSNAYLNLHPAGNVDLLVENGAPFRLVSTGAAYFDLDSGASVKWRFGSNYGANGDLNLSQTSGAAGRFVVASPISANVNSANTALSVLQSGAGYAATFQGGNVGIGTAAPTGQLHIYDSTTNAGVRIEAPNNNASLTLTPFGSYSWSMGATAGGNFTIGENEFGAMNYLTIEPGLISGAPPPLYIKSSGNVGIGTTTPTSALTVSGAFTALGMSSAPSVSASNQGSIYFDYATNKFRVSENGGAYTDLVTSSAGAIMNGGNTTGAAISIGTNDNYGLSFKTNNTTAMTISTNGNIGIGTTAPSSKLQVNGSYGASLFSIVNGTSTNVFEVLTSGGGHGYQTLRNASSTLMQMTHSDGTSNPIIYLNGSTHLADSAANSYGAAIFIDTSSTISQENGIFFGDSANYALKPGGAITYYRADMADNNVGGLKLKTRALSGEITTRMTIDSAGNVGIGTTTPTSALTVSGAFTALGMSSAPSVSASNQGSIYFDYATNKFRVSENGGAYTDLVTSSAGAIMNGGNTTGAAISIGTNDNYGLSIKTNNTTAMTISTNGSIGIGTTSPTAALDVSGAFVVRGYGEYSYSLGTSPTQFQVAYAVKDPTAATAPLRLGFNSVGNIKSIIEAGQVSGTADGYLSFKTRHTTNGMVERMKIMDTGRVGINRSAPQAALDISGAGDESSVLVPRDSTTARPATLVNGMIRYNNTTNLFEFYQNGSWVNYTVTSDGRLKTNVVEITSGIEKIKQLRPVYFDWDQNNPRAVGFGPQHEVGFIAQELEQVVPEVVHQGADSYRTVEYGKLVSVVVAAVKELIKNFSDSEEKIRSLESKVEQLEIQNRILQENNKKTEEKINQIIRGLNSK